MKKIFALFLALMLPSMANAWWSPDWSFRKMISLDTTPLGANLQESVKDTAILVRLHSGNFAYFPDLAENGKDLRFIANDDKTPLKFHIESYDAINQMALIWVKLPQLTAKSNLDSIWMYYGNASAVAANDVAGIYDVNTALAYHFSEATESVADTTAYAANAITGIPKTPGLIGTGAKFDGTRAVQITDVPPLRLIPQSGWTFNAWIKKDQATATEYLLDRKAENQRLSLLLEGDQLVARLTQGETIVETPRSAALPMGAWSQVGLVLSANSMTLYVNGAPLATVTVALQEMGGDLFLGGSADGAEFLTGTMDESQVSKEARSAAWMQAQFAIVQPESKLLLYGEDEQDQGGGANTSYFGVILKNVTLDGWVVIVILAVMAFISWWVMIVKSLYVKRVHKHNANFLHFFRDIDHPITNTDALTKKNVQYSQLYHLYHAGMEQVRHRIGDKTHEAGIALSAASLDSIRSALHATLTKQNQRLNAKMVLLTIAISGGPFLGLLGTVVGVMITFAAIAASGDVNINAIAPGIAAALVATVAGLAVAIPALFGYNYLGSQIKDISAEMSVFVDEYVNRLAEHYSR